jgi:hypothetical protein
MKDINGGELREGGLAMLLCEVLAIDGDGVRVRVLNSELEILVGIKHDEALGGLVADSELTAFEPDLTMEAQSHGEKRVAVSESLITGERQIAVWSTPPQSAATSQRTNAIAGDPQHRGLL